MRYSIKRRRITASASRNSRLPRALLALAALAAGLAGCNRDEAVRAFRSGSSDQLQAGIESIALGVINGVFTAIDTGTGDSGDANTSGAIAGGDTSTP